MAYKNAIMCDDEVLVNSFSRALELGAMPTVHAENGELVFRLQKKLLAQGINGPEGHPLSRPPEVEGEAANRAIQIAKVLNVPLYIVHNSCRQSLEAITRARNEGQRVYGEVLAGHLLVDDSVYQSNDFVFAAAHVMSPPFRPKEHQAALWHGLQSGNLQTTATDHCCFCEPQKAMGKDRLLEDPQRQRRHRGPACGSLAPRRQHRAAVDERVRRRHLDQRRQDLQYLSAQGRDRGRRRRRHRGVGPHRHPHHLGQDPSPEDRFQHLRGHEGAGGAAYTLSQGKVVWAKGELKAERGVGRYIDRPPFAPVFDVVKKNAAFNAPKGVMRAAE